MATPFLGGARAGAAEWHVLAGAIPGGDGSGDQPLGRVQEALDRASSGEIIRIGPGLYQEELHIERAVELKGEGKVVLAASVQAKAAVRLAAAARLSNLAIQGGRVGILAVDGGQLEAEAIEVRGQPEVGIDCGLQRCGVRRSRLVSSFAQAVGLRSGFDARVSDTSFEGPFKRAVDISAGRFDLRGLQISGAANGVHLTHATGTLVDSQIVDTRGPGLFAEGGSLKASDCEWARNEFAVLVRAGAEVVVEHSVVAAPRVTGIAGIQSTIRVRDHVQVEGGTDAAITAEAGHVQVEGALLVRPGPTGVRAARADLELTDLTVSHPRLESDGSFGSLLFTFDDRVRGVDWDAIGCPGPAVEVQMGSGRVSSLLVEKGGLAGLDLENHGALDVSGLEVISAEGVGVACIEEGRSTLVAPNLDRARQGPYLVDCSCAVKAVPPSLSPLRCGPDKTNPAPGP